MMAAMEISAGMPQNRPSANSERSTALFHRGSTSLPSGIGNREMEHTAVTRQTMMRAGSGRNPYNRQVDSSDDASIIDEASRSWKLKVSFLIAASYAAAMYEEPPSRKWSRRGSVLFL